MEVYKSSEPAGCVFYMKRKFYNEKFMETRLVLILPVE